MSYRATVLTDRLYEYMLAQSLREPEVLRELREENLRLKEVNMQIAAEQGQFMGLLVELMGARKVLEVGTFTGYSALAMALALPEDGRLVTCDVSEEWTATARRFWRKAGVEGRIDLRLGPAVETLDGLIAAGEAASFDFAFIDADKTGYDAYYERSLELLRPGGLIAIDNVFWDGAVADPAKHDPDTEAIRALNEKIHGDTRVTLTMVPVGDGLTLALKRG
ncbi:MAG: class I SAM-dependent methyltransferase [Alphaproteobacteria bacterium]